MNARSIDWLISLFIALLIGRLIDWLIGFLIVRSIDWLIDWFVDFTVLCSIDWLIDWYFFLVWPLGCIHFLSWFTCFLYCFRIRLFCCSCCTLYINLRNNFPNNLFFHEELHGISSGVFFSSYFEIRPNFLLDLFFCVFFVLALVFLEEKKRFFFPSSFCSRKYFFLFDKKKGKKIPKKFILHRRCQRDEASPLLSTRLKTHPLNIWNTTVVIKYSQRRKIGWSVAIIKKLQTRVEKNHSGGSWVESVFVSWPVVAVSHL